MRRVPEKGVSGTEYSFRTVEACFLHRMLSKGYSVPETPFSGTEQIFGAQNSLLWYATHFQGHSVLI